jgi:glucose/mannose transport system permease protein
MTTVNSTAPSEVEARAAHRGMPHPERWLSPLILSPSLIAIGVFVYAFIAFSFYISISNWSTLAADLSVRQPPLATYGDMFAMPRFQADLRNTVIFTVLFLALSIGVGLGLAVLLDHKVLGQGFFRNAFLFPYALSFVVTGVAWRWIFNPETGVNLLFESVGLNGALAAFGLGPFKPGWLTDPTVVWSLNGALEAIFPPAAQLIQIDLGIPLALIPVVLAAAWQLSGFAMAMYLAGLGTIANEVREAARMDGASELQVYRHVIIPMLRPITISTMIILGHVSLKIFDLVFVMSGTGPGFATDMPGIFVFEQTFKATRYNLGAAASIVMLLLVSVVIVPYLARSLREE